jgi:hypothetical protein
LTEWFRHSEQEIGVAFSNFLDGMLRFDHRHVACLSQQREDVLKIRVFTSFFSAKKWHNKNRFFGGVCNIFGVAIEFDASAFLG